MNEKLLINMMSYLEPDLLENDYIENDMEGYKGFLKSIFPFATGVVTIITFISTVIVVFVGVILFFLKRKGGLKLGKSKSLNLAKRVVKAVAN